VKIAEGMKRCSKCGEVKPVGEFGKSKVSKNGLQSRCKECFKKYYEENKEKIAEYRENNKEHCAEYQKKYNEDNKEKIAEYRENIVIINKEAYNINTAPEEMKPILKKAIHLKNLKRDLRQNMNKIKELQENIR